MTKKIYLCIDLKSFYASCECVFLGLNPLTTNLVVADPSRGKGAICLAITPAMKKLGIVNRCRLFDIPKDVKYIVALPKMRRYMEISASIYKIYLKYVSKNDIHVYSIDECFLDVSKYLKLYEMFPHQLAKIIIQDIYLTTGLSATCGIGTNLFLAKVALDVLAKHQKDGIAFLDEELFKKNIWYHKPITDIWNIARGISKRLEKYNVFDLHGITTIDEQVLYKEFGVNAELLIDHAYGRESCTIEDIHRYKPRNNSLSNSQILSSDYTYDDALLVLKEMVDILCLELVEKHLVTRTIFLNVGYSKDTYKSTGGSMRLEGYISSVKKIMECFMFLYKKTTDKHHLIRRVSIGFSEVVDESFKMIDLFNDNEEEEKEQKMQETIIQIKKKYGKNAVLKAIDFTPKATTRTRNKLIGGHNSGENV